MTRPRLAGRLIASIGSAPLIAWVTARVAVAVALAYSRFLVDHTGAVAASGAPPVGLLGWDAAWYRRILEHGYDALPGEALRFFPLLPVVAAPLRLFTGAGVALLVVSNLAALGAGVALHRLVRIETSDSRLADRTAWLFALFPAAFVFVMGYAESLLVLASIVAFLGLRTKRFGLAVAAGFAAGLARPLGVLLVLPALVEVARHWPRSGRERAARLAAVVSPVVGLATYLVWVEARFGDALRPLSEQQSVLRRGPLVDPITRLVRAGEQLLRGDDLSAGLHLPWALLFVGLIVVVARRLPVSYAVFSAATVLVALSASNLDSLERYGLSAFPLVIGLASLARAPWLERALLSVSAAGLVLYASLAFLGVYVP